MLTILSSIKEGPRSVSISVTCSNSGQSWHLCGLNPFGLSSPQHRHQLSLVLHFFQSLKDRVKILNSPSSGLLSCWDCQWLLGSMMSQLNVTRVPLLTLWVQVLTSSVLLVLWISFGGGVLLCSLHWLGASFIFWASIEPGIILLPQPPGC